MSPDQQRKIIQLYIKAYNEFNVSGMVEHLHPQIQFENIANGEVNLTTHGVAAFQQAESALDSFSFRRQEITAWEFTLNQVRATIHYQGTIAKDLHSGLKEGDQISLEGVSEFTFSENKIIGIRDIS